MARSMFSLSPWACLALLLSIFHVSVLATAINGDAAQALAPRQSPTADASASAICQNYATIANLTTIGLNSTYRAAFLRSSPLGTDAASSILDTRSPLLAPLTLDVSLNQQCGNLTTIALQGAATNFTNGIVAEFAIKDAPGVGVNGLETPIVVILTILMFGTTFVSL